MTYWPDPDKPRRVPAWVVAGAVVLIMRATVFILGPAIMVAALYLAFGPQPLPPA